MGIVVLTVALTVSAWLTHRLCDPTSRFQILDHPNKRSLHDRPTPRSGGIAILAALLLASVLIAISSGLPSGVLWVFAATVGVAAISYLDDRRGVAARYRLLVHFAAAGSLVMGGWSLRVLEVPGWVWVWPMGLGMIFSVLFAVWMTNLYNFMDGMDGFAGGMACFGFGTFALLGALDGNVPYALVNLAVVAAVAGFLLFNFPPAKIFMGDIGSSPLGFLAAAFTLWGTRIELFPFWAAIVVFSPFIIDATMTLIRRLVRGERIWDAHVTHYYQRLVRLGWGHRLTVLWEYALMLLCASLATAAVFVAPIWQWVLLAGLGALYVGLMVWVNRRTAQL